MFITGIVYPPQDIANSGSGKSRTYEQKAHEFTADEVKSLAEHMVGIPLCLKHNLEMQVGIVTEAAPTHCDGILMTAKVDDTTALGQETIAKLKDKYYRALSLGHGWICEAEDDGSLPYKRPREVTVCVKPRRKACFLQGIAGGAFSEEDDDNTINTSSGPHVHEEVVYTIDGHIQSSHMEGTEQPTQPPPVNPEDPTPMQEDAPAEEEPAKTEPDRPRNEQGQFAAKDPEAEADETIRILDQANQLLLEKENALKETNERMKQMEKELDEKKKYIEATEAQVAKDKAAAEKSQEEAKARNLKRARERIKKAQQDIENRLSEHTRSMVATEPDSKDEVDDLVRHAEVLEASIKDRDMRDHQTKDMSKKNDELKRKYGEATDVFSKFGGFAVPTKQQPVSVFNASADEDQPVKQMKQLSIRELYEQQRGQIGMSQIYDACFQKQAVMGGRGVYNASADEDGNMDGPDGIRMHIDRNGRKMPEICMQDLFPDLFQRLTKDYNGEGYGAEQLKRWKEESAELGDPSNYARRRQEYMQKYQRYG